MTKKQFLGMMIALMVGFISTAQFNNSPKEERQIKSLQRWSEERIHQWYEKQDWPVGANFVPSSAINQLEMWQEETFNPKEIDKELGWAKDLGFNTMRVFLHHLLWEQNQNRFLERVDTYLSIADRHGIKTMFVLLDDVWHPHPKPGKQPAPKPHVHNSGWVQSPGHKLLVNPKKYKKIERYVKGVISHFKDDKRILLWDLYNEPGNTNGGSYGPLEPKNKEVYSLALLKKIYQWGREVNPSQPISMNIWTSIHKELDQMSAIDEFAYKYSDVINFHCYADAEATENMVKRLSAANRPLFCTEYMARTVNSTFQSILPIFKKYKVAAYNWGLVSGKSQTIYPWDSWDKPYSGEPELWFHDVFRKDGQPYKAAEAKLIKTLTGKAKARAVKNPRIDIKNAPAPLYRDPVYDGIADPSILWNKDKQEWIMFYTQRRARMDGLTGVEYCYGTAIGIAVSKNNGVHWEYRGTANMPQPDSGLNSFWAPQVVYDALTNQYHMFVTYIKGVYTDWGGERELFRYTGNDLLNWKFQEKIATTGCIDAFVFQRDDGSWKMWYKDEKRGSRTYTATSKDLTNWKLTKTKEGGENAHEGPVIFKWKNSYWMLTDKWDGLDVYTSPDAQNWNYNNTILNQPGMRPDDHVMGRHADVVITDDKAYVVYFTHPGRIYIDGEEQIEDTYRFRKSVLQIAELEIQGTKMICNRNKYVVK